MQLYLDVVSLVISKSSLDNSFSLKAKSCSNNSAPSKARLYQSGVEPDLGNPGKVPSTECCGGIGNDVGEAYTGR